MLRNDPLTGVKGSFLISRSRHFQISRALIKTQMLCH